ncbi:two component transcriptional regulator, LuxR family [Polaromonas sp. YR568]|uniref:response regulator transcription factor n=1 Tax=Polaromonas sp. YR568 TaxID=1855301 RepID=UPI0008F153DE|nr:response regulator transcription factor [Polaromonas sp. YR568]SFU52135.1 two component transcriptional regulator, LuxR family [Polaromonas sp. YR568]
MQSSLDPPLIHVALVEDDVHFQNAIVTAITASSDIRLMSLASTRAQGLQSLESAPADVLLVDLGLPDGSGIDVIRAAHTQWPTCAVMVCTAFGDEAHVLQSIEAGASGYLLKDSEPENMLHEIRSLHGGGSPISPLIARQILMRFRAAPAAAAAATPASLSTSSAAPAATPATGEHAVLSAREKEVLELITKGFTADEIARLMQVSQHTVQTYVRRIYSKLNVNSRAEAIYEARHQGILAA